MSVATGPSGPPSPAGQRRRPDRLPRPTGASSRGSEIRLGVLGVLGLVLLIVGIPVALAVFVGYPLPRSAPSKDWLTASITATLIIKVLACVVWLVWAHFAVCVLTEWRAVRRGRLPGHVALGGGSQLLARRLIAAVLLLSGAATAFSHTGLGGGSGSSGAAIRPHAVVAQQAPAPAVGPVGSTPTASNDAARHASTTAAPAAASEHEFKYYVVQPPHGRRYDSLWDIADRTLHDPLRYKEIFALNKDRIQADGRKLVDANLIQPGWQLRLPADAAGPGVHVAHVGSPGAPAAPAPAAHTPAPAPVEAPAGAAAHVASGVTQAVAQPGTGAQHQLGYELFGGGLVLAGLLTALTARRGPYAPADADETLDVGADPGLVGLVDKALRHLAAGRAAQGRPLPHAVVAWASPDRVILNLAGGDVAEPPLPWRLGVDGRTWDLEALQLPDGPAPDVAAPFPGLLSVGRSNGFELFLDVEHAPGLISVAGDLNRGRELFLALAVQAATCRWSDGAQVTAVGFGGDNLVEIAPQAITQVPHLSDVLADLERDHAAVAQLQRQLGVDGVLSGRQLQRSDVWQPRLVLLSGPPTPDETARLHALSDGRSATAVLVLGDVASAPWRFTVDGAGVLDLGSLGPQVTAHRLSHEAAGRLVATFVRADHDRPRLAAQVRELTPAAALGADAPVYRPRPADAPVLASVTLLGPVAVAASGPMDPHRRALATEIVVAVALHPDGLHDAVLRASIWPRGVTDDVVAPTMATVQSWLGLDPSTGRPALDQGADGAWRLSDAVRVDWRELQALAGVAVGGDELSLLGQAVQLFQGEAFAATPAGRYGWLAFARAARDARVVGTAVTRRAAALLVEAQRREQAAEVLRRGLVLVPTAEPLWRDLLTLASWDGPDGAAAVAGEIYSVLRAHRIWPEAETDALIAQVAPSFDGPTPTAPAIAAS